MGYNIKEVIIIMKRSEINAVIDETLDWLRQLKVFLPPFAYWTPEDWLTKGPEYDELRENMLGWDVTDYGHGDFEKIGLTLFTLRNGNQKNPKYQKGYAEKLLISDVGQLSPNHFHKSKMEDIINRGGGTLVLRLWNSDENGALSDSDITFSVDGQVRTISAGDAVRLSPGESITLYPGIYHQFTAEGQKVLAWEVSMVNDDLTDNFFYEKQARFTAIEEDEPKRHLLCCEYPVFSRV